ncbi:MAG: HTTM domain-containing protein [Planctomycetaceae bacterium]
MNAITRDHTGFGSIAAGQGTASRGWLREWAGAWNAFWFTPSDPLPLAVVRIATGLLLTWSTLVWLRDADAFFGAGGWLAPQDVWRMNDPLSVPWLWSWYFASPALATVLTGLCVVAAVMLTVGLATPLAAAVSLAGVVSAVNRAPLNTFGLDDTLGLLLVGLLVGPSGARLSLDRRLGWAGQGGPSVSATIALRILQLQLCVVYFFSGCGKLLGASWWDGTAIWGAAANPQYRTLDLTFLARHPLITNAVTLATLFWEVAYAALVWPRLTRRLFLAMAVAVHLGIGLAMGMMEFGLAMIALNLAFIPADAWRALGRPFARRA